MNYRFEKRYFDLIAPDGTVCVVYLTRTTVPLGSFAHSGVEIYRPGRVAHVVLASKSDYFASVSDNQIRLDTPLGVFELDLAIRQEGWTPNTRPERNLGWSVDFARAIVHASWSPDAGIASLDGIGYGDTVMLTRLPRELDMSRLDWGRIHTDRTSVVFNRVRFRDGSSWSRFLMWPLDGHPLSTETFDLSTDGVTTAITSSLATIELVTDRVIHAGPAISSSRFPNLFTRALTTMAAGPIEETRRLSRARLETGDRDETGWALHETVRFGLSSKVATDETTLSEQH